MRIFHITYKLLLITIGDWERKKQKHIVIILRASLRGTKQITLVGLQNYYLRVP